MSVLIIGAGAIGLWLADRFGAGHEITLIGRERFVDAARTKGIIIQPMDGPPRRIAPQVWASLAAVSRRFDVIAFTTKAHSLAEGIAQLRSNPRVWDAQTQFLCFQNGVGNEELLAEAFGAERVVAATTTMPVSLLAPNHIKLERATGGVALAAMMNTHLDELAQVLNAETLVNYKSLKWSKMLLNIVGNASSAIFDRTVGEVYADPRGFAIEYRMLQEALAVMRAREIPVVNLPGGKGLQLKMLLSVFPKALVKPILGAVAAKGRGDKRPSFYYDVQNATGRSEIEWLNGAIVRHGEQTGVPAPVNAKLTKILLGLLSGTERCEDWRGNFERFV